MKDFKLCAFADEASAALDGQIGALRDNGIGYIELRGVDGTGVAELTTSAARLAREKLDAAGISVWALGSPLGKVQITQPAQAENERLRRLLELADIFGTKRIRIFSFYGTGGIDTYFAEVCERLGAFCELAGEAGVTLAHENEKGIWGESAANCRRLLDASPALGCIFDPANFVQAKQPIMESWAMLSDRISWCHIKDAEEDGTIVPPGFGVGHIADFLTLYASSGGGVLTIEPHLKVFSGLGALESGGHRSNIGARKSFATNREAFDCAVGALRDVIGKAGL